MSKPTLLQSLGAVLLCVTSLGVCRGQAYEVVTIKPAKPDAENTQASINSGHYTATNVPLKLLIQSAWNLPIEGLIAGLPSWAESARYDIEAKPDEETSTALHKLQEQERADSSRQMLRALLADRFGLVIHNQPKEMPMYVLSLAKGGSTLKVAVAGDKAMGSFSMRPGNLTAHGMSSKSLAQLLTALLRRVVVDHTGLTGNYDFTLMWTPDDATADAENAAPPLTTALREQLGLQIESIRGTMDSIVVDHIEPPGDN